MPRESRSKSRLRRLMPVTLVSLATLAFCAYASFVHFVLDTPEYAWKQANKAIAEEDWDTAEIHLRSVVQKRPEYVSARMSLVHVYRQREQAGLDKLEIALRKRRGDLMIPAPAVEQLVEVARLVPGETHARQLLLKVWQAEGRHDAAAKTARELYDLGDREVMTVYHVANNELQKDNWDSAEKLVDELVGLVDPGRTYESLPIVQMLVRLHRGRGNVYRTQALLQSTLDRVQQMTSVELQNLPLSHVESVGFLLRASCQDALDQQSLIDRCSVSLDVFDRLTPVRSTDRYAFETAEEGAILAGTLVAAFKHPTLRMQEEPQWQELLKLRQKLLARFVEQVEQALPSKDLSIRGHLLVAKAAIELGSDKQGLAVLSHGLTTYETDESASQEQLLSLHMMAAEQLIKQGRFDDANTHLEKLIASPQSASSGHLLAGLAAVRQGNTVQAREHLKQITGESTETLTAQVLMCACYVADGSSAKLLSALDAVEAVWADLPQERQQWVDRMIGDGPRRSLQRAQALAQLGQHQDAIRLLATLENSSVHEPAIVLGALVLNKSGQTAVAKDLLRKARYADRQSLPLLLAQVQMAIDSGEYQSAAMALRIFVGQTPEDVTARLVLARLLTTHLELDNEALAVLDEVRRIRPDLKQAWYSTANILIRNSRTWDLKDLLAELRKQPQIKHLVPLIEARMALKKSGLDEAEAVLRKADADVKQMAEWQMTSAILALHNGDAERALQLYAGALDDEQLNDKARAGFLQTLARALNQGDPARTRQQIADLLKQRPEEPTLLVASIALAANDEDFQAASQSLEQLKKHGRDGLQVAYWQARLLSAQGNMEEALATLKPLFPVKSEAVGIRILAGKLALFLDQPSEALTYLGPDQTSEPIAVSLMRAETRRRMNQPEEASRYLEMLVDRQSKAVSGWLMLARLYQEMKSPDQATDALRRGLAAVPGNRKLEDRLLVLLVESRQSGLAKEMADSLYQQNPTGQNGLRLAVVFREAGELDQGDAWLKRVRASESGQKIASLAFVEAVFLQERGVKTRQQSLLQEAHEQYERILMLQPGHVGAMNNLAWLKLRHLNQTATAVELVDRLRSQLSVRKASPGVVDTIAETLRETGRSKEALDVVEESLIRNPDAAILRFHRGVLLLDLAGDRQSQRKKGIRELEIAQMLGGLSKERNTELMQYLKFEASELVTRRAE